MSEEKTVEELRAELKAAEQKLKEKKEKDLNKNPFLIKAKEILADGMDDGKWAQAGTASGKMKFHQFVELLQTIPKERLILSEDDGGLFEEAEAPLEFLEKHPERGEAQYSLQLHQGWGNEEPQLYLTIWSLGIDLKGLDRIPTQWLSDVANYCYRYELTSMNKEYISVMSREAYYD